MLNVYPLWKYLLVAAAFTLGVIYALPNVYMPDFAIQISSQESGGQVSDKALEVATKALDEAGLEYFGEERQNGNALIRVPDDETQLKGKEVVQRAMDELQGGYVVALNSASTTPEWLRQLGAQPMKYGLDLRGGVHFLMEVDTESTVAARMDSMETDIKRRLREERLRYTGSDLSDRVFEIRFDDAQTRDEAESLLEDQYRQEFNITSGQDGDYFLRLEITENTISQIEDFAISQNLQTIRNRVNELGVAEPLVQRLGDNRIVVDLPGVQDTADAKRILGKVATLEFRFEAEPDAPRTRVVTYDYEGRTVRLERDIILRGDRVVDAKVGYDPDTSLPQVNITLDGQGGDLMHRATRNNIGRRMAVIFIETKTRPKYEMVDGEQVRTSVPYVEKSVISLATVQAALGVKFRITGLGPAEARELALLLRSGALAADMFIVEERTIGASLGEDNIRMGSISVVVGLALVLAFMLVYYKVFGLAANIALLFNLVLLVAIMSSFSATLTLPGIAGIVLTVGMAVDANVLIFSRIREELRERAPPQTAIDSGFGRAFVTILDANLTTLLVAVILYSIGTGPVKGFAVTLSIGIVTSMFTAIMGTRAIVNLIYGGRNVKKLMI